MKGNKRTESLLKTVVPLLLGILLLRLTYRKMDFRSIWDIIQNGVNYWIIIGSLFLGIGSNILRGMLWHLLIAPLTVGEPKVKLSNAIYATLGSYAVNMILPRAGEFWRCAEMGRYEQLSFGRLLGTLFVERIFDLIILGLILLAIFLGAGHFFTEFFNKNPEITQGFFAILGSIWLYVGLVVFGVGSWLLYRYLVRKRPEHQLTSFILKLIDGLKTIWRMDKKWLFLLYSIAIWVGYFFFFYVTFYAFEFTAHLGLGVGLIAFAMSGCGGR